MHKFRFVLLLLKLSAPQVLTNFGGLRRIIFLAKAIADLVKAIYFITNSSTAKAFFLLILIKIHPIIMDQETEAG